MYIIADITLPCTAEGLNRKGFSFFHLGLVSTLHNRNALAAMDLKLIDIVAVQVANWFHLVSCSADFDLVTLHSLLDSSSDIGHPDINTRFL